MVEYNVAYQIVQYNLKQINVLNFVSHGDKNPTNLLKYVSINITNLKWPFYLFAEINFMQCLLDSWIIVQTKCEPKFLIYLGDQ